VRASFFFRAGVLADDAAFSANSDGGFVAWAAEKRAFAQRDEELAASTANRIKGGM